jgi:glycosyltransferase involved in cell wall biosynthesis
VSAAGPADAGRRGRIRILALSPVPYEGAGCRFRIAHYIPYLATEGIDVTVAPFYDRQFFRLVYEKRRLARKAWHFLKQTAARLATVARAGRYDAIWIYREAFPVGPPLLEAMLHGLRRPLLYDFDDAVFLPNTSAANRYVGKLKYVQKIGRIIGYCDEVIAGNEYLATYARRFNSSVHVIPTSVDTHVFVPRSGGPSAAAPVVGWIGTPTTAAYLLPLGPVLSALSVHTEFTFRMSGAAPLTIPGVRVEFPSWSLEREVELFNTCDIGVYPLPDDDWARGKCGFKAIQFMACGVPVVASPVGVNREIIDDGVNGFLADSAPEWNRKLTRLLADANLRRQIGAAARRTIEERYSLDVNAPRVAGVMRHLVERSRPATAAFAPAAGDHR